MYTHLLYQPFEVPELCDSMDFQLFSIFQGWLLPQNSSQELLKIGYQSLGYSEKLELIILGSFHFELSGLLLYLDARIKDFRRTMGFPWFGVLAESCPGWLVLRYGDAKWLMRKRDSERVFHLTKFLPRTTQDGSIQEMAGTQCAERGSHSEHPTRLFRLKLTL